MKLKITKCLYSHHIHWAPNVLDYLESLAYQQNKMFINVGNMSKILYL